MLNSELRKRTAFGMIVFCLIFAALLVTATFTDLQVSRILTAGTLLPGKFLADGTFGVVFECLGCVAPFLVGSFCFASLFIYSFRFVENKKLKTLLCLIMFIAVCAVNIAVLIDVLGFNLRHYGVEGTPEFMKAELTVAGIFFAFPEILAVNNFSDDSVKKMLRFTYAALFAIAVSTITIELVKKPFGRPRYRAMNYAGDFSYYTRWYVINGQPDKEWMVETFSSTDACKSFPSGHTSSAAMAFCLVMFKDLFPGMSRKKAAALWIIPFIWTATVALSRIMVGAHFFSDVLIGGTFGFLTVMAGREIFICRGAHFKALLGKE